MARRRGEPLYRPIVEKLRTEIRDGSRALGSALPKPESIADEYQVSDGIARNAYEKLRADGLAYSRPGIGWFVTDILPDEYASFTQSLDKLRDEVAQLAGRVAQLEHARALPPARTTRRPGATDRASDPAVRSAAKRSDPS